MPEDDITIQNAFGTINNYEQKLNTFSSVYDNLDKHEEVIQDDAIYFNAFSHHICRHSIKKRIIQESHELNSTMQRKNFMGLTSIMQRKNSMI